MSRQEPATTVQSPSEFIPTTGGEETTSASAMLVAAYVLFWMIVLAFIALGWRKQRRLSERLDHIEKSLLKGDTSGG